MVLPVLSIAALSANKAEGSNGGTTPFTFTATRTGDTSGTSSVFWAMISGDPPSAVAEDFSGPVGGTVTFAPGVTTQTITLNVIADTVVEPNENFQVGFSVTSAVNATVDPQHGEAFGIIQNDDVTPPDLAAITVGMNPNTLVAGGSTTVSYTVANLSGSAPASMEGFYRSADATLDASDVLLTARSVPALSPGQSFSDSFALPLLTAGSYFVIAVADYNGTIAESSETNNAVAAMVNVTPSSPPPPPPGVPDLVPSNLALNSGTTLTYNLGDSGTGASGASTTGIYLSVDSTITTSDLLLATIATPALGSGTFDPESISIPYPINLTPGTYYLGVIADINGVISESSESNNSSIAIRVILGNQNSNTLIGTDGLDTILGLAGDDIIVGNGGADVLIGGDGNDTVSYSWSVNSVVIDLIAQQTWDGFVNNTLSSIENAIGSSHDDTFYSNSVANRFDGGGGNDTVSYSGSTSAVIVDLIAQQSWDGVVNDTLISIQNIIGSSFNDTFYSNAVANRFDGGAGSDTVSYSGSTSAVIVDLIAQQSWDGSVNDTFISIENIIGSSFNDTFYSNAVVNRFDGGAGSDTVSYAGSTSAVIVDLIAQQSWDGSVNDTFISVENIIGSSFNDTFYSNAVANRFDGGGGSDTVSYAGSTSAVIVDLIAQQSWDGVVNDTLISIENIIGSSFNDTFYSNAAANRFDGGAGSDTVSYAGSASAVIVDLVAQVTWDGFVNDTLVSVENAIGSSFNDTFYSTAGANRFDGGAGNDTVSYGASASGVIIDLVAQQTWDGVVNDTLSSIENAVGSSFNDTFYSTAAANRFDGGAGSDTVSYASSLSGVIIDLGAQQTWDGSVNDTLSSIENAVGSSFNDTIFGSSGDNVLDGGAGGADHINGGPGNDTVSYASSLSGVIIDLGAQQTWDGIVNDTLSSIENATGSSFNDTIFGSSGDNVLDGGPGVDSLTGGPGNDTFVFHRGEANGDTVTDFAGNGASAGDQFEFVGYGTAAAGATFTQVDATHWKIHSADGLVNDTVTLANSASVHVSDILFV